MKYLLSIFFIHFCYLPVFSQWEVANSGITGSHENISSMAFGATGTGFMTTSNKTLLKTTDGGKNWSYTTINKKNYYNRVYFYNDKTGYILTSDTIMYTRDGGKTWKDAPTQFLTGASKLFFVSATVGFAATNERIAATVDGGAHWLRPHTLPQSIDGGSMYFSDVARGVVPSLKGAGIMRDTCSKNQEILLAHSAFNAVCFISPEEGFLAGHDSASMLHTLDSGNTWKVSSKGLDLKTFYGYQDIHFVNKDTGYTCADKKIFVTTDGGKNWELQASGLPGNTRGFCFISPREIYAFGDEGTLLHTSNGGFDKNAIEETNTLFTNLNIYPNPANTRATIAYTISKTSQVKIVLLDIAGKQLAIVSDTKEIPGQHQSEIPTDTYIIKPGVYIMKFITGSQEMSRLLVKY